MLFAVYGLAPFLFAVYAGRVADPVGTHVLMYVGLAGFAATLALPPLFPSLPALFVVSPLIGFTSMLFIVAMQNLVGVLSEPQTRTRNFSYYSLVDAGGNVAGPVLVGFTIDGFGHGVTYHVLAVIAACCLAVFHFWRSEIPTRPRGVEAPKRGATLDLLRLPALRNALLTNGIVMTGIDLYNIYLPLYAHGVGLSASVIGLVIGAFGAAGFLVRLLIPPVTARWGEHAMIAATLAVACVSFIAMVLSFNAAPVGRSAEAIGMRMAVSYGAHVVIPPVFGALGAVLGLAPVFWTCAMLMGGGAALNRKSVTKR
jgi:MFS family permease